MKKLSLFLLLYSSVLLLEAKAQTTSSTTNSIQEKSNIISQRMKSDLSLSSSQVSLINNLNLETSNKLKTAYTSNASNKVEVANAFNKLEEERLQKLQLILTPQQLAIYNFKSTNYSLR